MADISLIQDVCMDDCDEGVYEQGDCSANSPGDEDLPPLSRIQKYATSQNIGDRRLVAEIAPEFFRTARAETLADELPKVMTIIRELCELDEYVRNDLLKQIPHMASEALKYSSRLNGLKDVTSEYLLPIVVRNLDSSDHATDKAAHATLLQLLERGLISRPQAEIQVCPSVLALSHEVHIPETSAGAVTLMSKMAPLLGRDVTERVFLKRFEDLCSCNLFYARKVCASHIGDFCAVVGKDKFEKVLLPCYVALCQDPIWGVRKCCAEVIMFISAVSTPDIRTSTLAPVFAKLLDDDCRWVQVSAYQTLGPFIATFANPPIISTTYSQGEMVLVNKEGHEFIHNLSHPLTITDVALCKYFSRKMSLNLLKGKPYDSGLDDWLQIAESNSNSDLENIESTELDNVEPSPLDEEDDDGDGNNFTVTSSCVGQTDKDIKEIVETVKNAVLSYRTVEPEQGVIGDNLKNNLNNNSNVISNIKKTTCDNLGRAITELDGDFKNINIKDDPDVENHEIATITSTKCENIQLNISDDNNARNTSSIEENNQVIVDSSESEKEDDLHLFNSYNYWYISPDMTLDLSILDDGILSRGKTDELKRETDESLGVSANKNCIKEEGREVLNNTTGSEVFEAQQDIVPPILISRFISMTDTSFAINLDTEMAYYCAYSLPAVASTLGDKSWPLLKHTIERLAGDLQYKVRRTVASSLHELALILGRDIATEHLTPIFEGFIKDLDEVRIGILKHLAYFLRIIKPDKRIVYLPRLQEFLKTENEWNWRFRHELAKQLLSMVTLFKPVDSAKHIGLIAEILLHDVSAVRQIAISLITELLRHISAKPGLNSLYLVRLVEKFAHSKNWKKRQTFALLCYKLLSSKALPPEQFATEIMPHLLDLSWDPVANVRLVVAKTLAHHVLPNEYFADPTNQHFDSLGTVIRRLQADKDRDVRQNAEISDKYEDRPDSPLPLLEDCNIDDYD